MTTYPASCPIDGNPVGGTLWSDPTVPMYQPCAHLPWDGAREPTQLYPGAAMALDDVATPTHGELVELSLMGILPAADQLQRIAVDIPRIGLCTIIGCDQTAIDGACLQHGPDA